MEIIVNSGQPDTDDQGQELYFAGRPVVGKLLVLSRSMASAFTCPEPWACISIGCEPGDWPKINKVQQVDLLQLAFADIEFNYPGEDRIVFSEDQATQILDFVEKNWDRVNLLMVHCQAGISRSAGTAAAIAKIKYDNDMAYYKPPFIPNKLVYRKILNVAHERGLI